MASVRGMTPEAILALIQRELANVKLSEGQIRDLIQTNTDIVDSIANLEDQVQAGLTGEALDQLNLDLQQLRSDLQTQAAALAAADTTLQENAQALIDNQQEMAILSVLLSDEGYLNTEKIKPGTLLGEHLAARTVAALNIAAGAIVSEKIAADAITANHILAESITGDRLVARSVGADRLEANSITANEISAGAITTNEIAVGAVTAENISAEGISADLITAGSLSATRVELAGKDLATQMDSILIQLDANFNDLQLRFDSLETYVDDRLSRPVFLAMYGQLDMPNNAYNPFMEWVNLSQNTYDSTGRPATLGFRVERYENSDGTTDWVLLFPETFEGRVQVYDNGARTGEIFLSRGDFFPFPIGRDEFDRLIWFAEDKLPYTYRWRLRFNVGGNRYKDQPTGYGFFSAHKRSFAENATNEGIDRSFELTTPVQITGTTVPAKGSSGGVHDLVKYSSDGTTDTTTYTEFPLKLEATIESAARSIWFKARMHIYQPKRADRYGFLIYKNTKYQGFASGTGVGTINGWSFIFSHEDVHINGRMPLNVYPGDKITLVPVILVIGSKPAVDAKIMEIELDLYAQRE